MSLAYWVATLAAETGSGAKAMATGPLKRASPSSPTEPSRAFLTKLAPQIGHFRNGQTQIVGHDHGAGAIEHAFQRFDRILLLSAVHCGLLLRFGAHEIARAG